MANQIVRIMNELYATTDGMQVSMNERERLQISDSTYTYGEINPATYGDILASANPQPGEVFYDLGSGAGKAVFCAALLNDWRKCCGIEVLPALHQTSEGLIPVFQRMMREYSKYGFHIEFIKEDMLKVNFSDADVVYLHATTFGQPLWDNIKDKLNQLKKGTRVIVNTKQLDSTHFDKLAEQIYEMGWGESMVFTYIKK